MFHGITQHQLHHFPGNPIGTPRKSGIPRVGHQWWWHASVAWGVFFFFFSRRGPHGGSDFFMSFHEQRIHIWLYDHKTLQIPMIFMKHDHKHCKYWCWKRTCRVWTPGKTHFFVLLTDWQEDVFFWFPVDDWMDVVKVCLFLIVN